MLSFETLSFADPRHFTYFTVFTVGVFGLCVGSFLNVVIYRVPFGDSLLYPPSRCPNCFHDIAWYQNVPVLSWLVLKAKCSHCHVSIPSRYPAVELLVGLVFVTLHIVFPNWGEFAIHTYFVCMLLVLASIDMDYFVLPDVLTFQLVLVGIMIQYFSMGVEPLTLLIDVTIGPAILMSIRTLYWMWRKQEGLGLGDVKLMAGIGAFLGWQGAVFTIIVGSFLGAVVGMIEILQKKAKMQTALPFGPFLAMAAIVWVYWSTAADPFAVLQRLVAP